MIYFAYQLFSKTGEEGKCPLIVNLLKQADFSFEILRKFLRRLFLRSSVSTLAIANMKYFSAQHDSAKYSLVDPLLTRATAVF